MNCWKSTLEAMFGAIELQARAVTSAVLTAAAPCELNIAPIVRGFPAAAGCFPEDNFGFFPLRPPISLTLSA
jgi:hypothetical protein